jgi:hypothetical protein
MNEFSNSPVNIHVQEVRKVASVALLPSRTIDATRSHQGADAQVAPLALQDPTCRTISACASSRLRTRGQN